MALGYDWTGMGSGSWSSGGATLTYIIEAKLDSQSTSENKSYISTRARTVMSGYYIRSYNVHMSCTGCSPYDGNNSTQYSFVTTTVLTGSVVVNHNADGTGSLSMSGACTGNLGMNIRPSGSIDLPKINRYSVLTTYNNFNIENGFSFGFTDYLSNKTLTLTCKMGNIDILTKTYTSSAGAHTDSIAFTEDQLTTIYNNIGASNKSAKFSLALATSGISPTSSKEATGTLVASSNVPSIDSKTVAETDTRMIQCGVLDDEIVRYLSAKLITATVSAQHGATISSVKVKNGSGGADYEMTKSGSAYNKTLSNLTANTFTLTATDTRGFTAIATINCTIKNYLRPSVEKIDFGRTSEISSTGYVRPSGSYWSGKAGNVTNSITWTYRISSTSAAQTATIVGNTWRGDTSLVSGTLLRENSYECVVIATDAFGQSASLSASIGPAKLSAWIGKETMRAEGFVGVHWIGLYKVGDIFLTLNTENPADRFGGTWELISQGRFLLGSDSTVDSETGEIDTETGTYKTGDTGGEATHTLTISEMPAHVHHIGYGANVYGSGDYGATGANPGYSGDTTSNATDHMGGNAAHNNMPPYLVCYIWQKIS